jgi:hypothetical protein
MAEERTHYLIFVASPSDVAEEREIARAVIAEVSKEIKEFAKFTLEACGWEDVRPGLGRPQALINPLVEKADLLVGILWKRFGTSTGVAESGTQEEFDIVYKRWQAKEHVDVMMYFRDVPPYMLEDPGPQLKAVLEFRREFERLGLYRTYEQPQQFADMLRGHLIDWVAQRHRTVTREKRPSQGGGKAFDDLTGSEPLSRFLKSQEAEHKYLQMTGFETRVRIPIELERVLVPVRARFTEFPSGLVEADRLRRKSEVNSTAAEASVNDFNTSWQQAQRKKINTLVVLGQPGSGKTTLLRHLLLRCIDSHEQLGLARPTVPLLLPLRLVRSKEDLADAIQRILQTDRLRLPIKFFDPQLFIGDVLLLFDGIDEVASAADREQVARWIENQRTLFPDCPMVVTSRFAGYVGDARLGIPHIELALERFREPEVRAFLERWFVTVETTLGEDTEFFTQRGRLAAADLCERIVATPEIFALATNPLMLQIIALVHRDRGALPERRVELYDECTNVLLEHWDRAKGGLDIPLTAKEARRVLQPVAYWMHEVPERRYAPASELLPLLRQGLSELSKKKVEAEEFLDGIRDRSGLFVGHGVDEYGFQHLSFQEFLAAGEVRRRERYADLVLRYGESWWREVTRLLMGLDNPSCFEPYMRLLVASDRFASNHDLTAACIRDAFEPSADPFASALKSTFEAGDKKGDPGTLQYYLLLALREVPAEKLATAMSAIKQASTHALTVEARGLATELLNKLGIEAPVEMDTATRLAKVRLNPVDGTELVLIPAGKFEAGSKEIRDNPPREMDLPAFYLARYPVTNAQYKRYLDANPLATKPIYWDNERFNQPEQPVVGVSWEEAKAYCQWAGLRLPTIDL